LREVERWLSPNLNYEPDESGKAGAAVPPRIGVVTCSCGVTHP
jgi:hypothetical protein